uniref:Basic tail secreted protein n=1 Tax=Rhipicephalus appendiculatus TaxID=34631 RepID=A0A131Z7Y8_RHIAP
MDVTRWGLALFIISGVVFPEAQTFHSTPLFCHRLMPRSPYHGTECSYPCALSHGHPSNSYGILYLAEEDWTPCSVGHCRGGVCVPAQDHALKRQKRSILLTLGAIRLGKKIIESIKEGRGSF